MTHNPLSPCLRSLCLLATALAATACGTFDYSADFANNELFYADVPFQTKAPGDRALFVTPIQDVRDPSKLPNNEDGFPIRYGDDAFWERPVPQMMADVLERQLAASELFPEVANRATAESVILKPSLVKFTTGSTEAMMGARTFAEVALRIQVMGPAGSTGERPIWHDQVYGNRQVSEKSIKPVSPYRLIGRALQLTMSNALGGLDGSNVGRSHVPIEMMPPEIGAPAAPAAAEASSSGK